MPFGLRYLALPPRAPLLFPSFPHSHYAPYCLPPLFPNPLSHLPFPQITSTPQFPPLEAVATSVLPFAVLLFRLPLLHSPSFVIFPLSLCLRPFPLLSLPCSLILFLLTLTHQRHFLPLPPLLPLPLVLSVRQSLTYISPFPSDLFLPRKLNWTTISSSSPGSSYSLSRNSPCTLSTFSTYHSLFYYRPSPLLSRFPFSDFCYSISISLSPSQFSTPWPIPARLFFTPLPLPYSLLFLMP